MNQTRSDLAQMMTIDGAQCKMMEMMFTFEKADKLGTCVSNGGMYLQHVRED